MSKDYSAYPYPAITRLSLTVSMHWTCLHLEDISKQTFIRLTSVKMTFRGGGGYPRDVIVQKCMHKPTFLMKIVTLRRGEGGGFSLMSK